MGSGAVQARSGAKGISRDDAYSFFSHDFSNILSAMLLRLELLRQDSDLSPGAKEDLAELEAETSRARFLTKYLMTLGGHKRVSKSYALDLAKLINNTLTRLRPLLGRNATFRFEPSPEPIWIFGETSSAEDLITVLCLHPSHAALSDRELILRTSLVNLEDNQNLPIKELRRRNFVCLSLTETLKSAEQVGVTTGEGKRHELALLPLEEFARQNYGWVETGQRGHDEFTIRVFLPIVEPPSETSGAQEPEPARTCTETILMVEDELALRRVTSLSLRKLGYAVLEAGSEAKALQIWEKHHATIDLLFTDMMMPGPKVGLELARKMRRDKAALKVIAASGQGTAEEEHADLERENIIFLTKPYNAAEVAKAVRECLDHHPQTKD